MHAHEIVREFQRIFGGTEVEYALHTDDLTLDRIAVRVAGWPEWAVYRDTHRLLTTLRALAADEGATAEGDARVCARIEEVGCLRDTASLSALKAEGWEVRE